MKKQAVTRLVLSRETLRSLGEEQLSKPVGAGLTCRISCILECTPDVSADFPCQPTQ
jgi:hypothetical protein